MELNNIWRLTNREPDIEYKGAKKIEALSMITQIITAVAIIVSAIGVRLVVEEQAVRILGYNILGSIIIGITAMITINKIHNKKVKTAYDKLSKEKDDLTLHIREIHMRGADIINGRHRSNDSNMFVRDFREGYSENTNVIWGVQSDGTNVHHRAMSSIINEESLIRNVSLEEYTEDTGETISIDTNAEENEKEQTDESRQDTGSDNNTPIKIETIEVDGIHFVKREVLKV